MVRSVGYHVSALKGMSGRDNDGSLFGAGWQCTQLYGAALHALQLFVSDSREHLSTL